jgi:predicted ATPase
LAFQQDTPPDAVYSFKHALVQEAAYTTLLRARRRQLHAAIAAALEREFPETVTAQPELLAHHCSEAGLTDQAVRFWHRAGERALERSANLEAVAHLTRGIEVLGGLPQSRERDEQELLLQVALVAPLGPLGDLARWRPNAPRDARSSCPGGAEPTRLCISGRFMGWHTRI